MYLNKAFVYGNLTRDPEIRSLPSGQKVASFSVATNRVWKDTNGARQENTDYHNIVVFGRPAETAAQYLHKGSSVMVEGRMQTRSWDDASGVKKYRTEIVADRVQFGPRAGGPGGAPGMGAAAGGMAGDQGDHESFGGGGGAAKAKPAAQGGQELPPLDTIEYPEEDSSPDDIPF